MNQNPAFLALGVVFYRWHNLQAAKLQKQNPSWDDEDIFQATRRRVIATLQVLIVMKLMYDRAPAPASIILEHHHVGVPAVIVG